jgi:hypothetical protein
MQDHDRHSHPILRYVREDYYPYVVLPQPIADTFTLNSPEHGSGKKRSHPAYLCSRQRDGVQAGRRYPAKP